MTEITTEEFIRKLIDISRETPDLLGGVEGDPIERFIASGLAIEASKQEIIKKLLLEKEKIKARAEKELAIVDSKIAEEQSLCHHWRTSYNRPTAECAPEYTCLTCGKILDA